MKGISIFFVLFMVSSCMVISKEGELPRRDKILEILQYGAFPNDQVFKSAVEWSGLLKIREAVPLLNTVLEKYPESENDLHEVYLALGRLGDARSIPFLLPHVVDSSAQKALDRIDRRWKRRPETLEYANQLWKFLSGPLVGKDTDPCADSPDCQCLKKLVKLETDLERLRRLSARLVNSSDRCLTELAREVLDTSQEDDCEEYRQILRKGDLANIGREIERLNDCLPDWRKSRPGVLLKNRCFTLCEQKNAQFDDKEDALELLSQLVDLENTAEVYRFIELLPDGPHLLDFHVLTLRHLAGRYGALNREYPYAKVIRQKLYAQINESKSQLLDMQAVLCWAEWQNDRLIRSFASVLFWGQKVISREEQVQLIEAMEQKRVSSKIFKLIEWFELADQRMKKAIVYTMALLGDPRSIPYLEKWRKDDFRSVRALAEWALFKVQTCAQGPNEAGR